MSSGAAPVAQDCGGLVASRRAAIIVPRVTGNADTAHNSGYACWDRATPDPRYGQMRRTSVTA